MKRDARQVENYVKHAAEKLARKPEPYRGEPRQRKRLSNQHARRRQRRMGQ